MSEAKHTPGPWVIDVKRDNMGAVGTDDPDFQASIAGDGWHLARVWKIPDAEEQSAANAKLIAAAPEMYRLLRYLLDHSNAKTLLSAGYVEDLQAVLAVASEAGES